MLMNNVFSVSAGVLLLAFALTAACKKDKITAPGASSPSVVTPATNIAVPIGGNSYITQSAGGFTEKINENGLSNWTSTATTVSVYFKVGQTGQLAIAIKAKTDPSASSTVKVLVNGTVFTVNIAGNTLKTYYVGTVNITTVGYVKVDLQGVSKTGTSFAEVSDIMIGGTATTSNLIFANDAANYYWSRRGPSCHLSYTIPSGDIEYFYSELTVPVGEDKIGSYFMANGFGEGYFGIQVNSVSERRILFSVWDPSAGQTTLVRKGTDVTAGRFGGEGTGGQSYMIFNWQAGTTYKFLTHGKPDGAGNTVYTSWFLAPETGSWKLMATFTRPNTNKHLTNFHGFLENFYDYNGYMGRKAQWSNQWIRTAAGIWNEVTAFKFTVDATGANKQRMDFAGGVENGKFFLQNGGFFANNVTPGTMFTRTATGVAPTIDFTSLP